MNNHRTITSEISFEMAHRLPDHGGACKRLHGHSYRCLVTLQGSVDPETGIVLDFSILKGLLRTVATQFDHKTLLHESETDLDLDEETCVKLGIDLVDYIPTAENMVQRIWWLIEGQLGRLSLLNVTLKQVRLYETATNYVDCFAGDDR